MIIIVILVAIIGVIWLMRNVPSISNVVLAVVGLATFLGALVFLAKFEPELLGPILSDVPAPDLADLSFSLTYKAVGSELPEDQKWWTLGTSNWVLVGSVVNNSDKELAKLKFEVLIKNGANIVGDEAVVTQRNWKVPPGQERAFITNSNAFKDLPITRWNPIWGVKLAEINNTPVKTDIVWSPDNPFAADSAKPASRK
jgi:hypothetical protein